MPTAVITESSEKTMSSRRDLDDDAAEADRLRDLAGAGARRPRASRGSRCVALGQQEQAADDAGSGRGPEISMPAIVEQRRGQADDPGERQQQQDARDHRQAAGRRVRPRACWSRRQLRRSGSR